MAFQPLTTSPSRQAGRHQPSDDLVVVPIMALQGATARVVEAAHVDDATALAGATAAAKSHGGALKVGEGKEMRRKYPSYGTWFEFGRTTCCEFWRGQTKSIPTPNYKRSLTTKVIQWVSNRLPYLTYRPPLGTHPRIGMIIQNGWILKGAQKSRTG